jgi:chaperonin GroES
MKIKPTRDLVLIEAVDHKKQTDSGILLQEDWKTLPMEGKILAVGPEVETLKEGDTVVFNRYASIVLEGSQRLCKERQVAGVL